MAVQPVGVPMLTPPLPGETRMAEPPLAWTKEAPRRVPERFIVGMRVEYPQAPGELRLRPGVSFPPASRTGVWSKSL